MSKIKPIIPESEIISIVNEAYDRTDIEWAKLFNDYFNSDEFKRSQAIHNADYKTKRHELGGYLTNRSANLGKRFKTSDGEMSQAEWNALHRTSESKTT